MFKAHPVSEIMLLVMNKIGVIEEIAKHISEKGINILAFNGTVIGEKAIFRMVTDDNLRAMEALKTLNCHPFENHAVLVELPHKPGMLRQIFEKLSCENISIHHIYSTSVSTAETASIVLSCSRNDHAVVILNG